MVVGKSGFFHFFTKTYIFNFFLMRKLIFVLICAVRKNFCTIFLMKYFVSIEKSDPIFLLNFYENLELISFPTSFVYNQL